MSRQKAQGTGWETELVHRAHDLGVMASRLAEGGSKDEGDVWIVNPPGDTQHTITALAWKRLVGDGRRRPDGERDVVVLTTNDFLNIVRLLSIYEPEIGWVVECKARQQLNVTRALHKARWKAGRRE